LTDTHEGRVLIMISSDLPEIRSLTDRLPALHAGSLAAALATAETQEEILAPAARVATSNKGDARMSDQKPTQTRRQP
jgi:ABC-type sugar transport system ATPase subunit